MSDNIVSYVEMCRREGMNLQQGMNFGIGRTHSVILMSLRHNAPYRDRLEDGGTTLIYEGHDQPRSSGTPHPKTVDQLQYHPTGRLTQNGKFHQAAQDIKYDRRTPERVRVYEKIHTGIWSYNGLFHLVDSWLERDELRRVFKFKLIAVEEDQDFVGVREQDLPRRRVIPTAVKLEVWRRDRGQCVICGANDQLHFDHDVPWSKGGASITARNVQLLCARHNLTKHDDIV